MIIRKEKNNGAFPMPKPEPAKPKPEEADSVTAEGPQNEVPPDWKIADAVKKPEEPAIPEQVSGIEVIGLRLAVNQNFIYVSMNGERVAVFVGKRLAPKLVGKKFRITANNDGGQTTYTYHP